MRLRKSLMALPIIFVTSVAFAQEEPSSFSEQVERVEHAKPEPSKGSAKTHVRSFVWQNDLDREYKLKGRYLLNFARFVTWPRLEESDEFRIGVLGESPISPRLKNAQENRAIFDQPRDRRLPIRAMKFATEQQIESCHILFLGRDVPHETATAVIERLKATDTFVVGEVPKFIDSGGSAEFTSAVGGVKFNLNLADAKAKGLHLSAQLLKAAHRIVNIDHKPSPELNGLQNGQLGRMDAHIPP